MKEVLAESCSKTGCDFKFCRGMAQDCKFSLVDDPSSADRIKQVVENSAIAKAAQASNNGKPMHHEQLKVAVAACPNACSQPQIKDIGVIASLTPTMIGPDCNGCGFCENVCREGAIIVPDGRARLVLEKCVGCGQCIKGCPQRTIELDGLKFRILVGGRMGRHPKWAEELCVVDSSLVVARLEQLLEKIAQLLLPGEKIPALVGRIGLDGLKDV